MVGDQVNDRAYSLYLLGDSSFLRCLGGLDKSILVAFAFYCFFHIHWPQDKKLTTKMTGAVEFVPEFLTIVHDTAGSLTKVYAAKADKYVLPMIRGHIERQRHRREEAPW